MFDNFRADIGRLHRYGSTDSTLRLLLFNQGIWACACYRAGRYLNDRNFPFGLRQILKLGYLFWWKGIEITTGISISPDCRIGPGLYIGHFGQIIVHGDVTMGVDCNLSQGVTIGLAEKNGEWGVPRIGNRVYLAPGAKVIGPIHLADGTVVGANAVLLNDTQEDDVVGGIPAKVISRKGRRDLAPETDSDNS